jgi:hypothetical protein
MLMMTAGFFSAYAADEFIIFNRDYYAVKDLNASDIWKLKDLTISTDLGAAKNAGVILGRHYVRQGDVEKGYKLLKDNLDDSYFDRFMKINAHLWTLDAAQKSKDADTAGKEKEYLAKQELDEKAEKAYRLYCTQEKLRIDNENVKSCIERVPAKKPESVFDLKPVVKETVKDVSAPVAAVVPVVVAPLPDAVAMTPRITEEKEADITPEPVTEEPLKPIVPTGPKSKAVVNVVNSFQNPEIVEAMLYTISRQKTNIELDFKGDRGFYDYVIDAGAATITTSNVTYDFASGRKENMKKAAKIAINMGAKIIVLGYGEGYRDTASEIADENRGSVQFYLFNIQEKDFQGRLKEFKGKAGGQALSYVIGGTQEQVIKILPFMKYYSPKPDKTIIVNAVDTVGKKYVTGEYGEFSKNTVVVSDLVLTEKPDAEEFANVFAKDFNKPAVMSDFIGHDFIQFIEKRRAGNGSYLSNIREIGNGVIRESGAYRIIGGGKLTKID